MPGQLLSASGEWAARLLIVTLAVTPLRMLFHQFGLAQHIPMWLFKRRRDLGLAAVLYAALHLATYVARQSNLHLILYEMQYLEYIMGWIAITSMLIIAVISNDWSVHHLGTKWKLLQRLVYVSAVAAFLHWLWIKLDDVPVLVHFAPLARELMMLVDQGEGVLILTDIFGATPANVAMKLLEPGRVEGVAGVNLPMLLRALTYRDKGMETLLIKAVGGGRDGVINMLTH